MIAASRLSIHLTLISLPVQNGRWHRFRHQGAAKPEAAPAPAWPQGHAQLQVATAPANPTFGRWGASGLQPPNSESGCLQGVSDLHWSLPRQSQRTCNMQAHPRPISATDWHRPGQFASGHYQPASQSSWIDHNGPGAQGLQGPQSLLSRTWCSPSQGGYNNMMESADPCRNPTPPQILNVGNSPVATVPHGAQWQQQGHAHGFQPSMPHNGTRALALCPEHLPPQNPKTQTFPPQSFPSHPLIRAETPSPRNPPPSAPSRKRTWTEVSFPRLGIAGAMFRKFRSFRV